MPTPSDATRFATRPTPNWWEQRVRTEIWYAVQRSHYAAPEEVWPRLEQRLLALCRIREHRNPYPAKESAA